MVQKSQTKFLLWQGFKLRDLNSDLSIDSPTTTRFDLNFEVHTHAYPLKVNGYNEWNIDLIMLA